MAVALAKPQLVPEVRQEVMGRQVVVLLGPRAPWAAGPQGSLISASPEDLFFLASLRYAPVIPVHVLVLVPGVVPGLALWDSQIPRAGCSPGLF